jgi:AraC-like DNA-binding protein
VVEASPTLGDGTAIRLRVGPLGECRPGGTRGAHTHEFFAIVYFDRDAAGWHQVAGVREPPQAGEVVALPPGAVHDFGGGAERAGVAVRFMRDAVSPGPFPSLPLAGDTRWGPLTRPQGAPALRLVVPPRERPRLRRLVDDLARELHDRPIGFTIAARAQLSLLLVLLSRVARAGCETGPAPPDPVVTDVLDLIEARFREPLSLAGIAADLSRSPRHLTRTLRELTGKTVMELIDDRRMDEARRLLVETDEKVDVIGYAVGYGDGSYFARRFRRAHGVSPSQWRATNGSTRARSARR